ncbi:MAG: 4-diphosphocytidyl-2-C-methyl-D-erythritol kinase [Thermotoga sp. 50_1627]|uniref:4-(cytidine 5'-diphospho)-2-C-methyl-D-erythritol kinase n=1 Tax=Pseudothermotoga sp. TaxID=2033661 RepID=UPI00076DAACB|nr:MAG: 4-diphosphocytidyl-2-C-methyl-D-erythritol kinase [Thermotoga sp. 50_64]KUK25253.1 MAG: 4-diphosphocytidyl-2-C-methyl-D-erythritol kinase [Thermotoga sp. 50_1627]MBC7116285.1 4-(cytidine 5'-diphospho)-2-C-methyl-D-erythritol kinase [Pseudothermotoga sp.]HBT38691.1 4-(cytidine 5'-diphospho)-2-C-methyl-D-erythritol kinase [Pseudothermotoga sp.]HCO98204.1 4-(cytidine 5'-diphospho)-2-C-methyl-D-erythritol kinase [Pseudothermotoga sp.]
MVEVGAGFSEKAHAKLNLYLDVVGKRPDGYHDIVGLFQTIELYDELFFIQTEKTGQIVVESNISITGENLVEKAYRTFRKFYPVDFGLRVILKKRIPVGSGLGGGSSDAAATLRFLAQTCRISHPDLLEIAAEVGSDVPFFLVGGTAIVEGKGEKITPLPRICGYTVDLFCPGVNVSTAKAYSMLKETDFKKGPGPIERLYEAYMKREHGVIRRMSYNVFQAIVCEVYPEIKTALAQAWSTDPIVAQLTGTGCCVFALHEQAGRYSFC